MGIFKKLISIIARISISVILLFFLFRQVDKNALLEIIKNSQKSLLFIAFLAYFFNYLLCLLRWEMLLKAAKIHLSLKRIIISFAGGVFFNLFLPSTIGGDLVRSIDLSTHTQKPKEVVSTVLLDRLSGFVGLVIVAVLALFVGWKLIDDINVLLYLGIIVLILISVLVLLFSKFVYSAINRLLPSSSAGKIIESLKNLHREIHLFRHNKKIIAANLALSLVIQIISPVTFYLTALSLGLKINIIYFLVFIPIITAVTLLPISIGGLGLRDASTIFFFTKVGVSKDLAFAMSLLSFFFLLIYGAIGGLIYVLTVHHRRLRYHPAPILQKST